MNKFLPFSLLAFLLPVILFAQSNYKPGYVATAKGDTIKGSIDYREWEKNPTQVTFKNNAGASQVYTAQNSNGFAASGLEYYEARIVNVSQGQVDVTKIGGVPDTSYRVDTVFLKILTKGKYLSLYSYRDDIKTRYYIMGRSDAQPQELAYLVYNGQDGGVKYVTGYRLQLESIAQKNNAGNSMLSGLISRSDYDDQDLLKIVAMINGGNSYQAVSQSQLGTRWFAGVGANYNDMLFTGSISYGDAYSLFPKVSAGLDILPNKITQQLFLRAELSATGDNHDFKDANSELKVSQTTASLILQVYYNFYNGEQLKVFAGGGLAVNFSTYPTRYYTANGGIDFTPITNTGYPDYHAVWESFVLKAGVIVNKKVEIYAGYSPPTTLTNNYTEFAGNIVIYQAGVNFLFGPK